MNLSSKRLETQLYFEELLGCKDPTRIKEYQATAPSLVLNARRASRFKECCVVDCKSFLFKGALSLISAVNGLHVGHQTWPLVQLYYATYYFLRADLLMRNRCTLRANQVFTVLAREREIVSKVSNRSAKSDHHLAILFAKKYIDEEDVLLSQSIDGQIPYDWMRDQRDWYQYKHKNGIEVEDDGPFFGFDYVELSNQIDMYLGDTTPYYCFDKDYAALALPTKKFQFTIAESKRRGIVLQPKHLKILEQAASAAVPSRRLFQVLKA